MSQNQEKNEETTCQNMVSNLPLLFTGGYPTSLEKISEKQLENFIPFMVQCSLGVGSNQNDLIEPEWWPENVPFTNPFTEPPTFRGDWLAKMKEIVVICYEFHKSIFLLRFCNELASYERECLRFINNYNSTTSLYERTSNRLLVTFRNENMLYDQQQSNHRRCLLPRTSSTQSLDNSQQMVEPALFDIYLCDNCDAELYSLQAYKEHEKGCQSDDDVIICEPEEHVETSDETHKKLSAFLSNFNLQSNNIPFISNKKIISPQKESPGSPEKFRRLPRRQRGVLPLSRCPGIPFSSPLGQFLIQKSKSSAITDDYTLERLERIDRFSIAPTIGCNGYKPRWMDKKPSYNPIVTFKRLPDHPKRSEYHFYTFPRRQFSTKSRDKEFEILNSILLKKCKPCSISLKKLTDIDVNLYKMKIKLKRLSNANNTTVTKPIKIVEYIDLCSSDEEDDNNENMKEKSNIINNDNPSTKKLPFKTQKIDGNILSIPIETTSLLNHNNSNTSNHILLAKPIQSVYLNLNNKNNNNNFYENISKLNNNNNINRENNILKLTTNSKIPPLVRISNANSNPTDQRRSLTANL